MKLYPIYFVIIKLSFGTEFEKLLWYRDINKLHPRRIGEEFPAIHMIEYCRVECNDTLLRVAFSIEIQTTDLYLTKRNLIRKMSATLFVL